MSEPQTIRTDLDILIELRNNLQRNIIYAEVDIEYYKGMIKFWIEEVAKQKVKNKKEEANAQLVNFKNSMKQKKNQLFMDKRLMQSIIERVAQATKEEEKHGEN